jgi:hypothetical protein
VRQLWLLRNREAAAQGINTEQLEEWNVFLGWIDYLYLSDVNLRTLIEGPVRQTP